MMRRHFLTTALAASTLPLRAAPSPLRIGQIGTLHAHAAGKMEAMRKQPENWEVVGLVAESKGPLRAPYDGLNLLNEEALLNTAGLKAVVIETEIEDSCATALRCLQAGKHLHLDKPGALKHEEFKAMRLEAEQRQLTVQMGYMFRYNPAFTLLRQAVSEGWLGQITEIDAAMGKLADPRLRQQLSQLPGGGLFELGCHLIDAVITLLGKPQSVHAFDTPTGSDGFQDNQLAVLKYPQATATIRCNHTDPFGGPRRKLSVTGTQGSFEILPLESGKISLSLTQARGRYTKGSQALQIEVPKGRYDHEFQDLARVLRGEKTFDWNAAHDITVHETTLLAAGQ